MKRTFFVFLPLLPLFAACTSAAEEEDTINIYAATSLQDSLESMEEEIESALGADVTFTFEGSGILQGEIADGAEADIFFSASNVSMDALEDEQLIAQDSREVVLSNELVMIENAGEPEKLEGLDDLTTDAVDKLAAGTPTDTAAGIYTQEMMESLGVYDEVVHKIVQSRNVKEALLFVASGETETGFVYATDAPSTDQVDVVETVDSSLHSPIEYPIALTTDGAENENAREALDYLTGPEAEEVFDSYGFLQPE